MYVARQAWGYASIFVFMYALYICIQHACTSMYVSLHICMYVCITLKWWRIWGLFHLYVHINLPSGVVVVGGMNVCMHVCIYAI